MSGVPPESAHFSQNDIATREKPYQYSGLISGVNNMNLNLPSIEKSRKSPSEELPSIFSGSSTFNYNTKQPLRTMEKVQSLKLDTTPEAITEHPQNEYMTTRPANGGQENGKHAVSPLTSSPPLSSASSTGEQAAEMQARILALQRSKSKRIVSPRSPSLSSPSISQGFLPRRSSSTFSGSLAGINGHLSQKSSSRTSVSTMDSLSTESEDDETSIGGSPVFEKSEGIFDIKPVSNDPTQALSRPFSPGINPHGNSIPVSKQPLASNGFDPNSVISPTAASFAASGGAVSLGRTASFRTRQRSSLSARRGMKLDGTMLQSPDGGSSATSLDSNLSSGNLSILDNRRDKNSATGLSSQGPQESRNRGLFRDYSKYVDVKTGSLNFAGKACVHAQGIQFSSGEKLYINMDELEFLCELGAGNYGTVQKVLHRPNGVLMAVKEIRLELDESSLRQIIMELDVLHRCEMSNIISFYGAFFVEGSVYICMEYMDGGSINKIYEGGIPEKYLKYIVRSVVSGLKQLKEQFNIIHRDVKPTNILCSTSGEVKLCDFGVSGNLVASFARTNIGCQAYMAPERIKVDRFTNSNPNQPMAYTAESDIWSLGLSIIEMAKGSYPYPTDSYASIFSQLNAIVEDPSPALDPTKFSPEACDFVDKLLSKSPKNRPKYADVVKHPWLAIDDCTTEEMGMFVRERLAANEHSPAKEQGTSQIEQPTVTPSRY